MPDSSPNFSFLASHSDLLLRLATLAERYVFDDPNTALIKIRQLAEAMAKGVASKIGIECGRDVSFLDVERDLRDYGLLDQSLHQIMRTVRQTGNEAVHEIAGSRREALHQLKLVRQLAIWFHKTVTGNPGFKAGPFTPPPDPSDADAILTEQLQRLREDLAKREAELHGERLKTEELSKRVRQKETEARAAFANEQAALELAQETEESALRRIAEYEEMLEAVSAEKAHQPPAEQQQVIAFAQKAASDIDLDEFDTRKLIDQQLREAGWEADSEALTYAKGCRPTKGKNLAIAEWKTNDGWADYVLFAGLTPVATVEAKRKRRNARSALDQAERYSRAFPEDSTLDLRGPWGEFQIPFAYSTNGNPYHRQLIDLSGVWFRDLRQTTNHATALTAWHTPEGLLDRLALDVPKANEKLLSESRDYLPLRYYQLEAIEAVETAIASGQSEILLGMATGTGKTRTAICLLYRLVKAGRFNRILFVVDRRSLGEQALDAFKDVKLENLQSFPEIYDVKELGDLRPERDTKLHISTIQSMVKRVLEADDEAAPFPIDQYDCIIVDECHRGYILDKEMSDQELSYRDQLDYVSKYRRVLDHFDAIRIGLTATPALHTTQIFGEPVYQYSYRQAVIDGNLVDHEPPFLIRTQLSETGMHWDEGELVKYVDTLTKCESNEHTPDEINIEIEGFNRIAVTEEFNRVVCEALAQHIDPFENGKTLIFCVLDSHADTVVRLLTAALEKEHGPIPHDTVKKITGDVERTNEAIRRFKNERAPNIVVTVDLLTTGIDVPAISNLVFLRCTKSRILFDQMLGRATRLCPDLFGPGEDKQYFKIYDAVGIYAKLQKHTDMKPVVMSPKTTFQQLATYINSETDPAILSDIRDQLIAKLRRKSRAIQDKWLEHFQEISGGEPEDVAKQWQEASIDELRQILSESKLLIEQLDNRRFGTKMLVNEEADTLLSVERGYGSGQKPDDYLESFRTYLREHRNDIPALTLVMQRPRDLTRKDLRDLQMQLAQQGFPETNIKSAVKDATNQDIAASIIGFVRYALLDEPLLPYGQRVDRAMQAILASQRWEPKQRQWLERIGKQLKENVIVDRELFDTGAFRDRGGFVRLNKVFGGKLEELMRRIMDSVWQTAG